MVIHFIILGSCYTLGKRIALDIAAEKHIDEKLVKSIQEYIKENCLSNTLSTHVIQTKDISFDSVREYDKFFENVTIVNSKEEFVNLVNKDRELDGLDVARYILTKVSCTHLKIQKLTYLCYADYLCQYNKKLFVDTIYAFSKGPVVKSVYENYKHTINSLNIEEDDEKNYSNEDKYMAIRSRILASENGIEKVASIDKTIENYANLSSMELVNITHKKNSPWCNSGYGKSFYKQMSDDTILQYHRYESI